MMRYLQDLISVVLLSALVKGQSLKLAQEQPFLANTSLQTETTDNGVQDNTTASLRAGPRGYVLLEDTIARKKIFHFDSERQPERVVHALGHGAYGTFQSYGDWTNLTSACFLKQNASSDVFVRFSVVVAGSGGSEVARDTHGFATKIYSQCGNQDFVGNHLPSFFINDGILFPDLIHAVKAEPDRGFPTGGTAHDTAYDFFSQRPEGTFQLMNVLSDLGIPRDVRHIGGAGVHTFRMLNDAGRSTLFKWYWTPVLGRRSLVYDEATKIAGKNPNFQRVDLWNAIEAGLFPEWELEVQTFADDGSYMYQGIDLLDPTKIIPFEMNAPIKLGRMILNRNPTDFFAEPENIAFAPSNVVKGITFVPDPLLQWRLMSYDDTQNHRHGSPNSYLLPINRPIAPVNNNYRDGYMQPLLYEGNSASSPNNISGVQGASPSDTLPYGSEIVNGAIGRYPLYNDFYEQARSFWYTLDQYAQQHTVDAYRFELGHVSAKVQAEYISNVLNQVDNCLARRVAYGIGATLPTIGSGSSSTNVSKFPSLYQLTPDTLSSRLDGLFVGILASDTSLSAADLSSLTAVLTASSVLHEVIAPRQGLLRTGATANQSYLTTSSIFYDAIVVGGPVGDNSSAPVSMQPPVLDFLREAYGHGKPLGFISPPMSFISDLGYPVNPDIGIFSTGNGNSTSTLAQSILAALQSPGRYPQRNPVDDIGAICL